MTPGVTAHARFKSLAGVLSLLIALPALAADKPPVASKTPAKAAASKPAAPDPWAGRQDLLVPPKLTPTTKVNVGAIVRFALPNGLRVLVVPRKSVPAIDVTLAVRVGDGANPLDKSGLAAFTAGMLRKGTAKRSSDQIAEAIDFVGGDLDTSTEEDATVIGCRARSKDLGLCLDLVSDVSQHPAFPEGEMSEIRDQLNADVEGSQDNPQALAARHAANLFFGDETPRGRPTSKRSIAAIDRAALVEFHKSWYAPNNAIMAISGDVDPRAIRAQVTRWFGAWKKQVVPKQPERPLPAPGKLSLRLVDKPDATQSTLVLVGPSNSGRTSNLAEAGHGRLMAR